MREKGTKGKWFLVTWPFVPRFVSGRRPRQRLAEAIISALAQIEMDRLAEIAAFAILPDHFQALLKPTALPLHRLLVALRRHVEDKMLMGERHRKPLARQYFTRPVQPDELPRIARLVAKRPATRGLVNTPTAWPYSSANPEAARLFRCLIPLPEVSTNDTNEAITLNGRVIVSNRKTRPQFPAALGPESAQYTQPTSYVKPCGAPKVHHGSEKGRQDAGMVRDRNGRGTGTSSVPSPSPVRVASGAKRVPRRNGFGAWLVRWGREVWKWLRRRLVPWDPDWQPRAEEVRAEFPQRGRAVRQGRMAEEYVARWLWFRGHRILARNVRCREGEIDIVVRKGKRLIAVEVRSYVEGGERPSEWLRYGKRRSIWRSIRRFQELRRNVLGNLEVHAVLAEVQFGRNGRILSVVIHPLRPAP